MGSSVERTDENVREYLLYRGFTSTLRHLDTEIKVDKDKGFRVDKMVDQLLHLVATFDLAGLREYWAFLDRRLFSRLEDVYRTTVNKLRTSVYRYYVVNTIQRGSLDKTQEFFQKQGAELHGQAEWRDWFVLPFIPSPEQHPAFSPYFSRQWADTFLVSLHNFLSVLFQCMPQPALLSFDAEVQRSNGLTEENEQLRQLVFALQGSSSSSAGMKDQSDSSTADEAPPPHHKLPAYVQNMDRLGDTELDMVANQKTSSVSTTPSRNFFSTLLPQGKRSALPPAGGNKAGQSPNQSAVGRKEPPAAAANQAKSKDGPLAKEVKPVSNQAAPSDSQAPPTHTRQKRTQDHEKDRKELFSKPLLSQVRADSSEVEPIAVEGPGSDGAPDSTPSVSTNEKDVGVQGVSVEQPFIKLSQEEYGEHHSSILHCRGTLNMAATEDTSEPISTGNKDNASEDETQCVSPDNDNGGIAEAGVSSPDHRVEEEEDRRGPPPGGAIHDAQYPLKLTYCGVCSLPTEFCQFTPEAAKCRQWLEKNVPDAFARMSLSVRRGGGGGGSEEEEEEEERKRQTRGGRGQIRAKKTTKTSSSESQRVTIARVPRAKKKFVTRVCGLAGVGVDLKDAKRFFAQRFSCGASLSAAGEDEIVVQGDVTDDVAAAILERWSEVRPECIHDLGEVKRVDCSGRRVASLDVDGVVKVWSFNPVIQTRATIMSKSPLLSLEWATKPDRLLLLGSGQGTVRLYDTDAKKNLIEMNVDEAHPRILSLACSPSGSSFVCSAAAAESNLRRPAPADGKLLLWDTKTVKEQLQFQLEPRPVAINCTAFNHNGNLLVTGAADGVIRLFDMQRYECAMSWRAHDGEVYTVEFSRDENTVFTVGEDGKFVQWNIHRCGVKQAEQELPQDATGPFVLSGYSGYKQVQVPRGRLFAFDSEGQHVLTCSNSGGVIYQLTNGEEPWLNNVLSLGGHRVSVVTVDWCCAVDCGACLTGSMDGKIRLSTLLSHKTY